MNRTQIYLEEEQIRQLDILAKRQGVRRSVLVRQGIDLLLVQSNEPLDWKKVYQNQAGIWQSGGSVDSEMKEVRDSLDRM